MENNQNSHCSNTSNNAAARASSNDSSDFLARVILASVKFHLVISDSLDRVYLSNSDYG